MSSASEQSDQPNESYQSTASHLENMVIRGEDIYEIYNFAANHEMIDDLTPSDWSVSGSASIDQFMTDTWENAPQVCFVHLLESVPTTRAAIKLSARQISFEDEALRNPEQYPVLYAEDICSVRYEEFWKGLVEDVTKSLCPLTKNSTKVDADSHVDRYLEAIEAVPELTSPSKPIQHYFFIAGLDRAYNRTLGLNRDWSYNAWTETRETEAERHKRYELTQEDVDQRERVKRMVDALVRLFHGRGKLVFVVGPGFKDFDVFDSVNDVPAFRL
ncbi:hypothetical protein E0Z10_g9948 [Xylaria hypoxylon]|uniref:Uncharacterized protein n=1 Tax=Xylaria hypoxylon TaxID=37992 RepID=A0A4Z0Y429_9PEZI|nr:hypothetical protein E0Z10_g9948 [Xylaria hypoxylon]